MSISDRQTIYRCYSPSRKECAEDGINGFTFSTEPDLFAEMAEERNHPSEPEPHDWELQSARVEWVHHVDQ